MDLELQGKVALVTGSTSGIGEAAVRRLAREGASVVVHGRRAAEAERIVADITAAGGTAKAALGDLSNDAGAEQAASAALAAFGPIDILVNNAAVFRTDNWKNLDAADWIDQYDKNVASIVRIVKHILPPMRTRGWGRIIQMSSVGAMMPSEMTLNYGGTKAAVAVFSTGLAKVLAGTGITVNTVTPGPVLTPMLDSWIRDIAKARVVERRFRAMGAPVRHRRATESAGPRRARGGTGGPHRLPRQSACRFHQRRQHPRRRRRNADGVTARAVRPSGRTIDPAREQT